MIYHYKGIVIFRNIEPGYCLRYTARLDNGTPLAANTLVGIKEEIRHHIKDKR